MPCSICGGIGHNKRTCPGIKNEKDIVPENNDDILAILYGEQELRELIIVNKIPIGLIDLFDYASNKANVGIIIKNGIERTANCIVFVPGIVNAYLNSAKSLSYDNNYRSVRPRGSFVVFHSFS